MADFNQINQFGSAKPSRSGEGMSCAECEAMLTDFIDGTLNPKDRAAFDLHIATCKECSQMLADAQRGAALLEMLKSARPEPPATMIDRIIAQTSGVSIGLPNGTSVQATADSAASGIGLGLGLGLSVIDGGAGTAQLAVPASIAGLVTLPAASSNVLPFRSSVARKFSLQAITRTMMQPRLAMTAAMAFFSIALTMNLTGVHPTDFKASDLKPSNIRHSFYQADASLVRYYDNLRVVYELESRVNDMKQSNVNDDPSASGKKGDSSSGAGKDGTGKDGDQKRAQPKAGSGTSQRRSPLLQEFRLADDQIDEHIGQHADRTVAALDRVVLPGKFSYKTNKSKETLQEGGLV